MLSRYVIFSWHARNIAGVFHSLEIYEDEGSEHYGWRTDVGEGSQRKPSEPYLLLYFNITMV